MCCGWAEDEVRIWKDTYGRTFRAEIVSVKPGSVRLKNKDGVEIDFPTMRLLPESLAQVRDWEAAAAAADEPSDFGKKFYTKLIRVEDGKVQLFRPENLGLVKYYVFFIACSEGPSCQQAIPRVAQFYKTYKPRHPEFELIYVSKDERKREAKEHMVTAQMPWPAIRYNMFDDLVTPNAPVRPYLMVTDENGRKILDPYKIQNQPKTTEWVLDELLTLLKEE